MHSHDLSSLTAEQKERTPLLCFATRIGTFLVCVDVEGEGWMSIWEISNHINSEGENPWETTKLCIQLLLTFPTLQRHVLPVKGQHRNLTADVPLRTVSGHDIAVGPVVTERRPPNPSPHPKGAKADVTEEGSVPSDFQFSSLPEPLLHHFVLDTPLPSLLHL